MTTDWLVGHVCRDWKSGMLNQLEMVKAFVMWNVKKALEKAVCS